MSRIYIVRHGQSDANIYDLFCGFLDAHLTELGKKQARMTADYMRNFKIDRIIASPLSRAHNTALAIAAERNLAVDTNDGLKEINFGEWEGINTLEVDALYDGAFTKWRTEPIKTVCPGGESFVGFYERAVNTLLKLAKANSGSDICLVSHGAWTKAILCYIKGKGPENFQNIEYPANASVTTIEFDGSNFTLIEEGHWQHLGSDATWVSDNAK